MKINWLKWTFYALAGIVIYLFTMNNLRAQAMIMGTELNESGTKVEWVLEEYSDFIRWSVVNREASANIYFVYGKQGNNPASYNLGIEVGNRVLFAIYLQPGTLPALMINEELTPALPLPGDNSGEVLYNGKTILWYTSNKEGRFEWNVADRTAGAEAYFYFLSEKDQRVFFGLDNNLFTLFFVFYDGNVAEVILFDKVFNVSM